ncbi:MAG: GreA/GreB family elongation factor [Acidimicrobiia bacterium]|nr:GreA/GreB family elongation factor [Acidimicrobiia bacterium]
MTELAIRQPSPPSRWPMTGEARLSLVDELGRLRSDLASLSGDVADGVVDLEAMKAARRLDVLSGVLDAPERNHESDAVVIGRRVTILEADGESVTYALVFSGDGDPAQGWISADPPLGSAVLGCLPGDEVEVAAPAGRRVVTVVSVE